MSFAFNRPIIAKMLGNPTDVYIDPDVPAITLT